MTLGLVSNCWRKQLQAGVELEALIDEAVQRGYRVVELRQTCLGRFETGDQHLPDAAALTELVEEFPGVRFNIAVCVPFLSAEFSPDDAVFTAGRWAAQAVAGEYPPHLRLVDLFTQPPDLADTSAVAASVAKLTHAMAELDGTLSIENSRQPWRWFREVFDAARDLLQADRDRLRLCYDPCNLLNGGDGVDPAQITASLKPDELSMVHLKQLRDGKLYPAVAEGDVDWSAQAAALKQMHYAGPYLFEVDSHDRLWEFLAGSVEYLRREGLEVG